MGVDDAKIDYGSCGAVPVKRLLFENRHATSVHCAGQDRQEHAERPNDEPAAMDECFQSKNQPHR